MHPDVSIVIVNWNACKYLRNCIDSIVSHTHESTFAIVVVDNASTDGSADMIHDEYPWVKLIANDRNLGFAGANNQGIRAASGRHVLLLNPDTVILDPVIDKTVAYSDQHVDVAVVGCQVLEDEDTIQHTCFGCPGPMNLLLTQAALRRLFPRSRFFGRPELSWWARDTELDVDVVSGMYMLVKRDAINQVGLMDEDYFMYAEEADWCYRFWQSGWRCVFAPVGRILHLDGGSKSTSQVSVQMYVQKQKSLMLFNRKNLGVAAAAAAKGVFLTSMLARSLFWSTAGRLIGDKSESRTKAKLALAASVFHILGKEPSV